MNIHTGSAGAVDREGRIVGRQGLRCLPGGGAPQPSGRPKTYSGRVPAGARRTGGYGAKPVLTLILSDTGSHFGQESLF